MHVLSPEDIYFRLEVLKREAEDERSSDRYGLFLIIDHGYVVDYREEPVRVASIPDRPSSGAWVESEWLRKLDAESLKNLWFLDNSEGALFLYEHTGADFMFDGKGIPPEDIIKGM